MTAGCPLGTTTPGMTVLLAIAASDIAIMAVSAVAGSKRR
jgi:hypothetical protein